VGLEREYKALSVMRREERNARVFGINGESGFKLKESDRVNPVSPEKKKGPSKEAAEILKGKRLGNSIKRLEPGHLVSPEKLDFPQKKQERRNPENKS